MSPLLYAIAYAQPAIAKLLLLEGADPQAKSSVRTYYDHLSIYGYISYYLSTAHNIRMAALLFPMRKRVVTLNLCK